MNPEGESTVLEQSKSVNSGFLERQLRESICSGRVVVMVTAAAGRRGRFRSTCHGREVKWDNVKERETEITFQYRYNSPFFNG